MKRILVIDDDAQLRKMLRQMLERQGYGVIEAGDGKEGMALYRQAPTELIITDIIMPEKEGVETIIELRRDFPDVKIIAISGGSRSLNKEYYLELAKRLGAAYTFTKPFARKELLEAIEDLLTAGVY